MNILSIQSAVAYGHVGNAAAVFPLQRLGAEVWPINTVQFSNHPGYGTRTGEVFPAAWTRALVDGIAARGVLGSCDAVLSGYLGEAETAGAVAHAVALVRAARPDALYCCDPVIGDAGAGVYVRPGVAEAIAAALLPAADIATPNRFELTFLTGQAGTSLAEAKAAARALASGLRPAGPRTVLVTSLRTETTPADAIDLLAVEGDGAWLLRTPMLALAVNGAGDALAALFLFHRLASGNPATALGAAASALHGVLRATAAAGARELALVAAQNELVAPSVRFVAQAC